MKHTGCDVTWPVQLESGRMSLQELLESFQTRLKSTEAVRYVS